MPRLGRAVLPGYPHHVVQRGHDKQAVFATDDDYRYYLGNLAEFKALYGVKAYAYCLMTNHVHLLLAPSTAEGLGQLMKRLAGRQTRYRNGLEGRTGTMWESRYKSSVVDQDGYLLACVRYIELNPVRARMVGDPEAYAWSSCAYHLGHAACDWLDRVPGLSEAAGGNYRAYMAAAIAEGEWALIRQAVQRGQLTGGDRFVDQVEAALGRRIERRAPGRPRVEKSVG
jgi:putative transposase